ncbi:MAG TPA: site-specific DNA-methyltransferase, partial [Ignavibacteria bacterium]
KEKGKRKFILVQMEEKSEKCENICKDITRERIVSVIKGYKTPKGEIVKGLDGSFDYYKVGEKLFTIDGEDIESNVNWQQLAPYIYFTETGNSILKVGKEPYIGRNDETDYYLIYKKPQINILDEIFLKLFKKGKEQINKVVYADVCKVDEDVLDKLNITFKQIPYDILSY